MSGNHRHDGPGATLSTVVLSLVTSALCTRAGALCEHDWQGLLAALYSRYELLERASALGHCSGSINNETAAVICYTSKVTCKDPRPIRPCKKCCNSAMNTAH